MLKSTYFASQYSKGAGTSVSVRVEVNGFGAKRLVFQYAKGASREITLNTEEAQALAVALFDDAHIDPNKWIEVVRL